MSQHFSQHLEPANWASLEKKSIPDDRKRLGELFSTRTGGGERGKRLHGATLPPADHRNQNASKSGRKPILLAWLWSRGFKGDAPENQKTGTSRRGPGKPPLDPASSARLAHRTTARRARSQDIQEDPKLLRAGSGPAPGSSEVRASLPACVCWEISPRNCLELSTEGPDPRCPGPVQPGPNKTVILGHYAALFSVSRLWIKVPS